jgi:hypothetical protein
MDAAKLFVLVITAVVVGVLAYMESNARRNRNTPEN